MRENVALLFIIIIFIIGYFKFTSKINKDKFVDIRNIGNISLDPLVLTEKISLHSNRIVQGLKDNYFS
jgi:hypothetical protein